MPLPTPHLDDRTFQGLVDEAKRMVQQRCPEWTDHNVSDPGITLIETFAYMVDQLIWRLNRVPDKVYVKFLELLGVSLRPPTAARTELTFWLSAAQDQTVVVPAGTQAATLRTEVEGVTFTTVDTLSIVPCSRTYVATEIENLQVNHTETLDNGAPFHCFARVPSVGDCFYVGLSNAVPSGAVSLDFECDIEGVGVNPQYPPLVWEAWNGARWVECEVERDETGGLNRNGSVVLHLPRDHAAHAGILRLAGGWLRCRVVENQEWQPAYSASPRVHQVRAWTAGASVEAINANVVKGEIVGISEGVPSQRFALQSRPVVPVEGGYTVAVSALEGWQEWAQVETFALSGPHDRHVVIEETSGEIVFGPAVREPDGTLRHFGAVPEKGAAIRIGEYRTGGGLNGNVPRRSVTELQDQVPYIDTVGNRRGALGGSDGETLENAKVRGPIVLRTRHRAVTRDDYERLAEAAAAEVARARCVPAGAGGVEAGGVKVLIVPQVEDREHGSLDFGQLMPSDELLETVTAYLDERRVVGTRVLVESATYIPMSIVARMRAKPRYDPRRLEAAALEALYGWFHPVRGGPDGTGWPFGRTVAPGEAYAILNRVPGVEAVEEVRLYPALPLENRREAQVPTITPGPSELVFSWEHQVQVRPG
ncbi:MAG TPA: putative baseplate assembly protein [Acidimicrobiales bacterium]|nr:putative baseplate assembly protein [Acidimicrobiales bacterium]